MGDYIKRDKAIDELRRRKALFCKNQIEFKLLSTNDKSRIDEINACIAMLINMPPAQPERIQNNTVHLCDSCQYTYETCPSHGNDAVFGDGKGNDNICACNKYRPISAQPERKRGKWRHYEGYLICSECRTEYDDDIMTHCCDDVPKFCPNCGADMRQSNAD